MYLRCIHGFLLQITIFLSPLVADVFWEPMGPEGGSILPMIYDQQNGIYAQGGSELFHFDSNENRWTHVEYPGSCIVSMWPLPGTGALFCNMDTVILVTRDYRKWTIPQGISIGQELKTIYYHTDGNLIAVTSKNIYRSSDSGSVWIKLSDTVPAYNPTCLFINKFNHFVLTGSRGVYYSEDKGKTWSQKYEMETTLFTIVRAPDSSLLAGGTYTDYGSELPQGRLFRSLDEGRSWVKWDDSVSGMENASDAIISLIVNKKKEIIAVPSPGNGLMISSDNGRTWHQPEGVNRDFSSVYQDRSGRIWGATDSAVALSEDNGWTWKYLPISGFRGIDISSMVFDHHGTLWGCSRSRGIGSSTNGGITWNFQISSTRSNMYSNLSADALRTGPELISNAIHPASDGSLIAATMMGIYTSIDNGSTWTQDTGKNSQYWYQYVLALGIAEGDSGLLFASTTRGLFRRKTGEVAWNATALTGINWYAQMHCITSKGILYVYKSASRVGDLDTLYQSSDKGDTWNIVSEPFTKSNQHITGIIEFSGDTLLLGTSSTSGGKISMSTDGAVSWKTIVSGVPPIRHFTKVDNAIAGAVSDSGVMISRDRGITWSEFSTGLQGPLRVQGLVVDSDGHFIAGTDNGVFRTVNPVYENRTIIVSSIGQKKPQVQIEKGAIRLSTPFSCPVSVTLFSLDGKMIVSLFNAKLPKGTFSFPLNRTALPSGCTVLLVVKAGQVSTIQHLVFVR